MGVDARGWQMSICRQHHATWGGLWCAIDCRWWRAVCLSVCQSVGPCKSQNLIDASHDCINACLSWRRASPAHQPWGPAGQHDKWSRGGPHRRAMHFVSPLGRRIAGHWAPLTTPHHGSVFRSSAYGHCLMLQGPTNGKDSSLNYCGVKHCRPGCPTKYEPPASQPHITSHEEPIQISKRMKKAFLGFSSFPVPVW